MLNLKKNRLDYGRILMPPENFRLTRAIATTYSVDLHTLLAVPVALFFSKSLDGNFEEDRFDVLESIQETAKIIRIYCQKGKIKIPREHNHLFAFIENSIVEITPPSYLSSFHPKVWILRFENGSQKVYRVNILSRNLTFDRSWDLAFYMDGAVTKKNIGVNEPLVKFAKHLIEKRSFEQAETFIKDLHKVEFENHANFDGFKFHPIGIDNFDNYKNPLDEDTFEKLLIITPFIDRTIIQKLHKNSPNKKCLISRKEELDKIPAAMFEGYDPYYLSRRIVEGEELEELEESGLDIQKQQLHAKAFLGERSNRYFWFLGSANCTDPAFTRNTEFMVELTGRDPNTSPECIKNNLINNDDDGNIFEEYASGDKQDGDDGDGIRQALRKLEHELVSCVFAGAIELRENRLNYDLSVAVDLRKKKWEENFNVKIAPLNVKKAYQAIRQGELNQKRFANIREIDLSRFIAVAVYFEDELKTSFLVKLKVNFPKGRKGKIIKNLIDSREKFFKYLGFLLSESPYSEDNHITTESGQFATKKDAYKTFFCSDLPIFEQLLLTASRNSRKLGDVNRLIQRLRDEEESTGEKIVPDEFIDFWEVFQTFTKSE